MNMVAIIMETARIREPMRMPFFFSKHLLRIMAKCAKDINEQSTWQELTPRGEIYEGGTARMTITGEWRANIPVWDPQKCKQCLLCAPFCPDASIPVTDGKRGEFDFDHCKGCGICWKVCPFGAIDFVKEEK